MFAYLFVKNTITRLLFPYFLQFREMILISALFFRWFTRDFARSMALYPFILVRSVDLLNDPVLLHHERIHLRQQLELGILPFYLWYLIEFLIRYIIKRDFNRAYRAISFEKEAYARDDDPGYLKNRRLWAFLSYLT